jgi:hypothetical protein
VIKACRNYHLLSIVALGVLLASLQACSVGMALSGKEAPNLAVCRVGAPRSDVEAQLGPPVSVSTLPDGTQSCTYEYELGNAPSPGRAVAHGALDVLTLGMWEVLAGTPVEAGTGSKYRMTVVYDQQDAAKEITISKVSE